MGNRLEFFSNIISHYAATRTRQPHHHPTPGRRQLFLNVKEISNAHFLIFTSPIFRFNIRKQEFPPLKLITVLPIEVLIVFPLLKFEIQILDTSECIFSFSGSLLPFSPNLFM